MLGPKRYIESVNIQYYAIDELTRGTVIGLRSKKTPTVVGKIHKSYNKIPIGISLQDVISIGKLRDARFPILYNSAYSLQGAKIEILTKGSVTVKMAKSLRLPQGQPIYVDLGRSVLSWKRLGPEVGKTLSPQDENGWLYVDVNFL